MADLTDFATDADYLRAVGMEPEQRPELWCWGNEHGVRIPVGIALISKESERMRIPEYDLGLHDTAPVRKWQNLANVLLVLGPEMDRRSWTLDLRQQQVDSEALIWGGGLEGYGINDIPHIAILTAFLDAHKGESNAEVS